VGTPELRNFTYTMRRYDDPLPEESGCLDIVGMTCHGFAVTHIDALCHIFTPQGSQGMYNGYPISNVTDTGTQKLGIEHVGATGIVGRGVLLDVAEVHGGALPLGTAITPDDLEAAEQAHNVTVSQGDIVFIRNGAGASNTYRHASGLHAACLPWLHERGVAVLSSDSDSDVHPAIPGFAKWTEPIHMVAIPYMGADPARPCRTRRARPGLCTRGPLDLLRQRRTLALPRSSRLSSQPPGSLLNRPTVVEAGTKGSTSGSL
jgi:kynurenine formamidase